MGCSYRTLGRRATGCRATTSAQTQNGTAAIPNAKDGVVIADGASDNLVGGETPGERNLISGNGEIGVNLSRSAGYAGDGATANRVLGNYIGTDVTGTQAMGNGQFGVHIGFGAYDNVVGGAEGRHAQHHQRERERRRVDQEPWDDRQPACWATTSAPT